MEKLEKLKRRFARSGNANKITEGYKNDTDQFYNLNEDITDLSFHEFITLFCYIIGSDSKQLSYSFSESIFYLFFNVSYYRYHPITNKPLSYDSHQEELKNLFDEFDISENSEERQNSSNPEINLYKDYHPNLKFAEQIIEKTYLKIDSEKYFKKLVKLKHHSLEEIKNELFKNKDILLEIQSELKERKAEIQNEKYSFQSIQYDDKFNIIKIDGDEIFSIFTCSDNSITKINLLEVAILAIKNEIQIFEKESIKILEIINVKEKAVGLKSIVIDSKYTESQIQSIINNYYRDYISDSNIDYKNILIWFTSNHEIAFEKKKISKEELEDLIALFKYLNEKEILHKFKISPFVKLVSFYFNCGIGEERLRQIYRKVQLSFNIKSDLNRILQKVI